MTSSPWHTAGRPRHSHSASRTPQSRSGTGSPNQQGQPIQPPRQNAARPQQTSNVWTQRSSSASGSNGPTRAENAALGDYVLMNGFNAAEVKAMLSKEPMPASYKPAPASGAAQGSASAWGTKCTLAQPGMSVWLTDKRGSKSHGEQSAILRATGKAGCHARGWRMIGRW